ncbi:hypothetical protein RND61_26395 [Streptomyces sp. TRM76323]|uniref:Uncharacterized protein n=1 Tax=Streptomyces tamarix TaxID=3078565 RepID=A0ABU3QS70_9ACTN|nr:hypothetical protein [Streptomyces tamarix]MDT9685566.1 hypothetical protein [Streptomyces tamarix]
MSSSPSSSAVASPEAGALTDRDGSSSRPAALAPHTPGARRSPTGALLSGPGAATSSRAVYGVLHRDGHAVASLPGFAALPPRERNAPAVATSAALGAPGPVGVTHSPAVWGVRSRPDLPEARRRNDVSVPEREACPRTDSTFAPRRPPPGAARPRALRRPATPPAARSTTGPTARVRRGGRIRVLEPDDDSFPPRGRPRPRPAYGLRFPDEALRAVHAQTAVRLAPVAAAPSRAKEAFPWR